MSPHFFTNFSELRKWYEKNHDRETQLLVGFYKTGSGKHSISWSESVDEALCFGWIDGVRRSIDKDSYCIRFTPRKSKSIWSAINIQKVADLNRLGRIRPAGLAAFEKREEHKSKIYAYENEPAKLNAAFNKKFKSHQQAWTFFMSQAPSYQRTAIYWVMNAKQEKTREARMETLIEDSAANLRIKHLRPINRKF